MTKLYDFRSVQILKKSDSFEKNTIMNKNVGNSDRLIRLVVAIVILVLYMTKQITGTAAIIALILAIVFAATAYMRFCPLYLPFGINTIKKSE